VPRDDVRIGEPCRYIERKPAFRAGKKFRRGQEAIVVRGSFNSRFSIITVVDNDVRFTPKSGHVQCANACPLWAKSGLMQRRPLFDHLVGASKLRRRHGVARRSFKNAVPAPVAFQLAFERAVIEAVKA
jgi:hypothetical protein